MTTKKSKPDKKAADLAGLKANVLEAASLSELIDLVSGLDPETKNELAHELSIVIDRIVGR